MKKRIWIIARWLTKWWVTRFIENILNQFNSNEYKDIAFVLFTDNVEYKNIYTNITCIYIGKSNKLYWDYIKILRYLRLENLDFLIYPKNIIPFTHSIFKFKKVNIIHDLAYFEKSINSYKFFDTIYMKTFMKLSCKISHVTLAVSEYTKNDIINKLNINSKKVKVIYEWYWKEFNKITTKHSNYIIDKYKIKKPFLFYCWSLSPRKNILRLLKAFHSIKDEISHNIYFAIAKSWNDKDVINYINNKLYGRVFIIRNPNSKDLVSLYNNASLYVYPSLYEWFWLPILEAQACGCPVLTSNVTSCPEVAWEWAHIINPYDIKDIKKWILKILSNENYSKELKLKGFNNLNRFSWEKTANTIIEELN